MRTARGLARCGTISLEELVGLQVIHGPRRAQPGTYDAWVTAIQAVDPRFEFTDPPFRHSLAMTLALALAAAGNRPAAVLTGPAIAARRQAWPIRRSRLADTYGMVRVSLQHHPLTASAALVWSGDLPRLLQQMLFDTAASLTEPTHPQPTDTRTLAASAASSQRSLTLLPGGTGRRGLAVAGRDRGDLSPGGRRRRPVGAAAGSGVRAGR